MKKESGWKIYRSIDSIAGKFLDTDIPGELEKQFGEKAFYDLDMEDSKTRHALASFELSYLVSEEMARRTGNIFYDHRADDFEEFIEEINPKHSFNYSKDHLMQYHNLYTNLGNDLDLDLNYPSISAFTPAGSFETAHESLIEFLEDIDKSL